MDNNRNLILAFVISLVILLAFDFFYMKPKVAEEQARQAELEASRSVPEQGAGGAQNPDLPGVTHSDVLVPEIGGVAAAPSISRDQVISDTPRIAINSPRLRGSISLKGGRVDDLVLKDYRVEVEADSPDVVLASPAGTDRAYYAEFGWAPVPGSAVEMPNAQTVWTADRTELTSQSPVTLTWVNGQGLTFSRIYQLDENYMFTVTQIVKNNSDQAVAMAPYSLVMKAYKPETKAFFILHEGPLGVFGEERVYLTYSDLEDDGQVQKSGTGGWIGITDKYWLMALVPDQKTEMKGRFTYRNVQGRNRYQVDVLQDAVTIQPGQTVDVTSRLFAGAKETMLISKYEKTLEISRFVDAVDWGWFVWITKPMFYGLHYLHQILGNFGLAILALTVVLKLIFFPLANKSYVAMSKMKKLQPKMQELKEKYGEDRAKMQQELMGLYKKEKVNPMAGCLPILLQIPVFFALYKVIFVTIEMRHAPFYGWVHDLSAQDTLTPVNLFGLIPWDPPSFLMIGIWPILMGITMFLQQKLNPAPTDPIQAKVMSFLPIIFTFILAPFPAGLVIYWTWNNLLSILQQWVIMKRMGVSAG